MPLAAMLLAAAAPPTAITPTGPWIVRYDESLCLLERNYPIGDQQATIAFKPLLDLPTMELIVLTPDRSESQLQGQYSVQVNDDGKDISGKYYSVNVPKSKLRLTRLTIVRDALDQLKDGDILRLRAKPVNLAFRVVHPEKARVALKVCVEDLKKAWGIDPAVESRVASKPEGNPARYFGSEAYPAEALHQGIYGRVVALLNIAADGSVEHCRIVSSAGKALNDGTCKAALRIRFKPARDADGKPLASTYLMPVKWTMPGAPN